MTPTAEQWIQDGRGLPLPQDLSIGFDRFLSTLPWQVATLDWKRMPRSESLDLSFADRRAVLAWGKKTRIGAHTHIAVWYSVKSGGLVVPAAFGLVSLDELYWGAPGVQFAFGVDVLAEQMEPAYGDLLQYGDGDQLIAVGA